MKIIKKSNICSYRENDKTLVKEGIDGLHFITRNGFEFDADFLNRQDSTMKQIIYETENDENCSMDYIAFNIESFLRKYPNLILSLDNPEIAICIQEMLRENGKRLEIATHASNPIVGDYILYTGADINNFPSEKTDICKMIELLKNQKKIILDFESFKDETGQKVIEKLRNETNDSDNILLSTWVPKRVLK